MSAIALVPSLVLLVTGLAVMWLERAPGGESPEHRRRAVTAMAAAGLSASAYAIARTWGHRLDLGGGWMVWDALGQAMGAMVVGLLFLGLFTPRESGRADRPSVPLLLGGAVVLCIVGTRSLLLMALGAELLSLAASAQRAGGAPRLSGHFSPRRRGWSFLGTTLLWAGALSLGALGRSFDVARIEAVLSARPAGTMLAPGLAAGLFVIGWGLKLYRDAGPAASRSGVGVSFQIVAATGFCGAILHLHGWLQSLEHALWIALGGLAVVTMAFAFFIGRRSDGDLALLRAAGVSHVGFVLVGIVAGGEAGSAAAVFYLWSWAASSLGAVAALAAWPAGVPLFALSLVAMPPTVGFMGRFLVLDAAVAAEQWFLAGVAAIGTGLNAYLYSRLLLSKRAAPPAASRRSWPGRVVVCITAACILYGGLAPASVWSLAQRVARELF